MLFDKIGMYRGIPISTMSRQELLDFADYASKHMSMLERMQQDAQMDRIEREAMLIQKETKSGTRIVLKWLLCLALAIGARFLFGLLNDSFLVAWMGGVFCVFIIQYFDDELWK